MTTLPVSAPQAPIDDPSIQIAAHFGQLVQKIVQSNSGRHKALVPPVPRIEREDCWAEYRTMAERTQSSCNFAHAEAMWLKAIFETHSFDNRDWRRAYSLDSLAILYYSQNRLDEAEVFAERALEATRLAYGTEHLKTAECEMFLGSICFSLGKMDDAVAHVKCSLFIYEAVLDPVHSKIATACLNLAIIYHARGVFNEAETYYQRAFKIRANVFGWEHDKTSSVSKAYAEMAIDRKNHLEAKEMLDRLIGPASVSIQF